MRFTVTKDGGRVVYALPPELFCWGCGVKKDSFDGVWYYYDRTKKLYCRDCAANAAVDTFEIQKGMLWMIDEFRYGGE